MKTVKIIFGALAALVTLAYLVQFIGVLTTGDVSTLGITRIVASLAVLCFGAAITVWLFQTLSNAARSGSRTDFSAQPHTDNAPCPPPNPRNPNAAGVSSACGRRMP